MESNKFSSLEIYMNKVFKTFIVVIPCIALCAGATFSVIKALGYYEDVSWLKMLLFDTSCFIYFVIGYFLSKNCEKPDGSLDSKILFSGKIYVCAVVFLQWNFISYIIPSRDYWAYIFLFVGIIMFFLDSKLTAISIAEVLCSMIISWFVRPDELLPVRDEHFVPEMILRCVLIVLGLGMMWVITYSIEKNLASELEKIADFDTLTMLYNRRKLDNSLNTAVDNSRKTGAPLSILMIDIDDFKKVNDEYGHGCGDAVLKAISRRMRNAVGDSGTNFRYGGEELFVLLNTQSEEAMEIAEDIREKIRNEIIVYNGKQISVTVTIGAATFQPEDHTESLIARADSNLYYGKNHGKNCVIK